MSYFRRARSGMSGLGQAITDPSQVDDGTVVANLPPTRVSCQDLPADSPWRQPGQICEPPPSRSVLEVLWDVVKPTPGGASSPPVTASPATADPMDLGLGILLGGGAVLAYYLLRKKKR